MTKEFIEEILEEYGVTFTGALSERLYQEFRKEAQIRNESLRHIRPEEIARFIKDDSLSAWCDAMRKELMRVGGR